MRIYPSLFGLTVTAMLTVSAANAADIVKCAANDGTITYTDDRCSASLLVGRAQAAGGAFQIKRGTQWAEPVTVRRNRPDVESIRAAREELLKRDGQHILAGLPDS